MMRPISINVSLILLLALAASSLGFCGDIHDAAKDGDLEKVEALLKDNPDLIDSKDQIGYTPLHWAADRSHEDVVKFLLVNKAEVNVKGSDGRTPLHAAMLYNGKELLEVTKLLLSNKADVNARDSSGKTPLHYAAKNGNMPVLYLLLKNGAEVNVKDDAGCTPLCWAERAGKMDAAELLHQATASPSTNATQLVTLKDDRGKTALIRAAQFGNVRDLMALISAGADPNAKDDQGETALLALAAAPWSPPDNDFLLAGLSALITAGADPNAQDNAGNRTLSTLVQRDHLRCATTLIIAGADATKATQLMVDRDAVPPNKYENDEIEALRSEVYKTARLKHVEGAAVLVHVERMSRVYQAEYNVGRYVYDGHRIVFLVGWRGGAVTDRFDTRFPDSIAVSRGTESQYMSDRPSGFIPPIIDAKRIFGKFLEAISR